MENVGEIPNTFEQDFGPSEFEQRAEQRRFGGQAELGRETLGAMPFANAAPEAGASASELGYGDANALVTEVDGQIVGTDLTKEVKRNNERLTKNTIQEVEKIGEQISKDPHDGTLKFSAARNAYLWKAFNRVIGERNDGSKQESMNIAGSHSPVSGVMPGMTPGLMQGVAQDANSPEQGKVA